MQKGIWRLTVLNIFIMLSINNLTAQISPGDLSNPHSNLEGISNCTQCHVLGNKQTNEKCLACHTEINERISSRKGYHSSSDVKGKQCFSCHSEHNGKNFQLIRLDINKFDHKLTGYTLSAPHAKKECKDCHASKFIGEAKLKSKKNTYLGVKTECLNCHNDYHIRTLSSNCLTCHSADAFVPASKFNHANAKFQLAGKHKNVDCVKCHKISTTEGKKYQQFSGMQYNNCTSCHKDPHSNKFGQNCRQCHSEESFKVIQGNQKFDHNKTDYKLEGKHLIVNCKACHKGRFTDPLKFTQCVNCHTDYHKKQFVKSGVVTDCSQCHTVDGFKQFSFTVEQHNAGPFPLKGSHIAIPCYECHRKQDNWSFRQIGMKCSDCHQDIHQNFIAAKYYPEKNCLVCHSEDKWSDVRFDHSKTEFQLTGAHKKESCRACHFKTYSTGTFQQTFQGLSQNCSECHSNKHRNQFEKNGITNCTECHGTDNWKASKFDHNKTAFRLDGKHINVSCTKCHKPQQEGSDLFVLYKIKEFKCESCHF
ncbi:MAG: cytochrome C [Bacteroidales bacterium]|nr:cytochrome C [Bacteroidales bacterium]